MRAGTCCGSASTEDATWWAAKRLAGDDGLLALLVGPHEQAAHLASHVLYTDCWAPDPGAVRAAWSVSDAYRPVLAEMAARAGWVPAAEEWATRAGQVPVAEWCAVAHALLPLRPDPLAAADLWDRADPQGGEVGGLRGVTAAAPAVMRRGPSRFRPHPRRRGAAARAVSAPPALRNG